MPKSLTFLGEASMLTIGMLVLYLHWTGIWEFRGMAVIGAAVAAFCGGASWSGISPSRYGRCGTAKTPDR